ncbi:MAG: hypothetical protein J7L39_01130 [Candidatus Aenigmarchaeota archaeon]|nr:hypothetical protein [Candidatus Aenigmarchaeota archaeon]
MIEEKFLIEEGKPTFYEKLCRTFGILPIKPWKSLNEKYEKAIKFSHLRINSSQAFSTAILFPTLLFFSLLLVSILGNFFSSTSLIIFISVSLLSFYYLANYPIHYAKVFRVKASSEMILAIIYMVVSMKISPNLENAIKFAAKNLRGPLAKDLKKIIWKIYTSKEYSLDECYNELIEKWKVENSEFAEALDLIRSSLVQSPERAEKTLDEAVDVIVRGTTEKMKSYVLELNTPITIINALGILLPILGMTFLPVVSIFMPDLLNSGILILSYNLFLPSFVYFLSRNYLEKIPYTFVEINVDKHPNIKDKKKLELLVPFLIFPLTIFSAYKLLVLGIGFSFEVLLYSTLLATFIFLGFFLYFFISSQLRRKLRNEIMKIEREFSVVLFNLGQRIKSGVPIETALEDVVEKSKQLNISKFFRKILYNIRTFGMGLERAIFDEKYGAIKEYPSALIENVMKAVVEISRRGSMVGARAMIMISTYLKNVKDVEITLRETTAETTSTLEMQGMLLAPLATGIVVSLAAIIMKIMIELGIVMERMMERLSSSYGLLGTFSGSILFSLANLEKATPFPVFELIISIYLLEVAILVGIFVSFIKYGDDKVMRNYTIARFLLFSMTIFPIGAILIYKVFESFIEFGGLFT